MREEGDVNARKEDSPSLLFSLQRRECESCAVCKAKLDSTAVPKLLPCLHPMCKACISNNSEDRGSKECPVCGQLFTLAEVSDCFLFQDFTPKCGGCEESSVSNWCMQCDEALCSDCVLAHQRVKVTRNHTVISKDPVSGFGTSLRCTSHRQERLMFFCLTCDELTCRDCQLFDHRGHSFLLLEEAVVSQKEQLMKKLHSIKDQRNSLKDSLQALEKRLENVKESKVEAKKELSDLLSAMYMTLVVRWNQLSKEMEDFYAEEEKNLNKIKTNLKRLGNKQEYMAAFIHKILSTKGQCILLHKKQLDKQVQNLLSQRTCLPDTVFQLSLQISQDLWPVFKTLGSYVVSSIPPNSSGKHRNRNLLRDALEVKDSCSSALTYASSVLQQALCRSKTTDLPQIGGSEPAPLTPVQLTPGLTQTCSQQPVTSNPIPSQAPSVTHTNDSLNSLQNLQFQTAQSTNARIIVNQVSQGLPQSVLPQPSQSQPVFRSLSHPQPSASISSQNVLLFSHPQSNVPVPGPSVLKVFPSTLSQHSLVTSPVLILQPQSCGVAAGPHLSLPSHPSFTGHSAFSQFAQSNNLASTQSHSLSNKLPSSAPSVQSSQTMCKMQHSGLNAFPKHAQQSFPPTLPLNQTSTSQTAIVQKSQPAVTQSKVQSRTTWNFYTYIPPSTSSQATKFVPQQAKLTSVINWKSPQLVPSKVPFPPPSHGVTDVPVSNNKTLDKMVSSNPSFIALSTPSAPSEAGQGQHTCTSLRQSCEPPVKAPADSVCEQEIICTRSSLVAVLEETDSNLPTSTVPETDIKELPAGLVQHSPPISSPDLLSRTLKEDCSHKQSTLDLSKSPLSSVQTLPTTNSTFSINKWLTGLHPKICDSLINTDEVEVSAEDAMPSSSKESLPSVKGEEEEETDISDSELVEQVDETISEVTHVLKEASNRYLHVSLLRLPISGSPSPQFRIVTNGQKDEILLQEIQEDQPIGQWLRIPVSASVLPLCIPESPLSVDVLDCAVCLSAGASLLCSECGRSFHPDCHVPTIIFRPVVVWVCTLCQDVSDTDLFSHDRLEEPYLNLQDQRKCEQLLLSLMCEENCYLLYKTSKTAGCVEFDFIVKRLLGKCIPPYRSAAEMVSDLWAVFDILSATSRKRDLVFKLQSSFQERLNAAFGESLHASLLKPCVAELNEMAETDEEREKAKNTLKRMREFLAANSAIAAKKPYIDNRSRGKVNDLQES